MTPDEFRDRVLPRIVTAWDAHCLCQSPGFRKLLSFNFRDYGRRTIGLADAEILIQEIIRRTFIRQGEPTSDQGELAQVYLCPQCGGSCTELYAEFSVSMYHSCVTFDSGEPQRAAEG